ncbi:DUF1642 domain-containing protein [Pseudolactococcus piscium]|uniref:DUF1642 domain-containing protein n=1 Tax=Pseudolactococcus piscium MKFS47 TaxID=297352 RepID=A0A0D6DZI2_9LACT|nr:DUF1642 domain-containing protein [Lactococcus piscium]CEN29153.1 Uncharacterized protein LACPI_1953 [Lactococcus piscium MKFS47]
MSEFEKELEKNIKLNKVAYERESFYSDFLVSQWDIERIFKYWQPPKPLVVVPRIVADWFETNEDRLGIMLFQVCNKIGDEKAVLNDFEKWFYEDYSRGFETLIRMKLDGYTVEKEKLYLLKHIEISNRDTTINCYLTHTFTAPFIGHTNFSKGYDMSDVKECHFKQSEIDGMETGSYEQIEVEP